ncbi:hypothetical protein BU15DRAFT_64932 [Melanogaster broomeanus]|nr:hypothetical protein BU15DRAFT_64932 [Melanogaster broomeanus]
MIVGISPTLSSLSKGKFSLALMEPPRVHFHRSIRATNYKAFGGVLQNRCATCGRGSLPPDIPFDELYANESGLHAGAVVQGHESLTVHQLSDSSDMASHLNPSDVAANFSFSYSKKSAVHCVGSSSGQVTFDTGSLQDHRCTIDNAPSPCFECICPIDYFFHFPLVEHRSRLAKR